MFRITADEIKKAQHLRRCAPLNVLTQGSSLCSPTLGYQKQNPDGVRQFCKHPLRRSSFWNGYQKQKAMGFVNLQTSYAPLFLLTRDEIKKAQHRWRCVPLNVLTQGSLHYRLATLGYQKQNPDGVRQFANILCAALPFEMSIKNRTLMGFVYPANILCRRSPLLGKGLGVRL